MIGDDIKRGRQEQGFKTLRSFAERVHIDVRTLNLIETNRRVPTLKQLYRLGEALNTDFGGRNLDKKAFGVKLSGLLWQRAMTQGDLAKQLFISHTSVWRWINGHALPDDCTLGKIADILGMPLDDLLEGCEY